MVGSKRIDTEFAYNIIDSILWIVVIVGLGLWGGYVKDRCNEWLRVTMLFVLGFMFGLVHRKVAQWLLRFLPNCKRS